jgi:hypothetical protein
MNLNEYLQQNKLLGSKYVSNTDDNIGQYCMIDCITACTFTTLDGNMLTPPLAVPLAAGTKLYGRFTKVKLTSGTCVLYNGYLN